MSLDFATDMNSFRILWPCKVSSCGCRDDVITTKDTKLFLLSPSMFSAYAGLSRASYYRWVRKCWPVSRLTPSFNAHTTPFDNSDS